MRVLEIITGHVIYNLAYTYKFQLKTTINNSIKNTFEFCAESELHTSTLMVGSTSKGS